MGMHVVKYGQIIGDALLRRVALEVTCQNGEVRELIVRYMHEEDAQSWGEANWDKYLSELGQDEINRIGWTNPTIKIMRG